MNSTHNDSSSRLMRRRHRAPRSCAECRRRKVKCDRKKPCNHCITSKKRCFYNQGSSDTEEPPETANITRAIHTPVSQIAQRQISATTGSAGDLTSQYNQIRTQEALPLISPLPSINDENELLKRSSALRNGVGDHHIQQLNRRLQTLEHTISLSAPNILSEKSSLNAQSSIAASEYGAFDPSPQTKTTLNKSRLFGPTHWTNDIDEVSLAYYSGSVAA